MDLRRSSLYSESWNIAWREKSSGNILEDKITPFYLVDNPYNFWVADPFLFEYRGVTYIFAELYDYRLCRGTIGYSILGKKCNWNQIIVEDFHLSYPCIQVVGDEILIFPESGASKTLYAYRAIDFPNKWEKIPVIRNGVIYGDTTPFIFNNKRYAFTYNVEDSYRLMLLDLDNAVDDMFLTEGNQLEKRPAGQILVKDNYILRPAQICVHDYGEGLIFYKGIFNGSDYHEIEYARIYPKDLNFTKSILIDGMHTYNATNKYEIIDIKTRRFNLLNFIFRIINKIK